MTTAHRLSTRQMAEFVANGFIRFPGHELLDHEFVFERRIELT